MRKKQGIEWVKEVPSGGRGVTIPFPAEELRRRPKSWAVIRRYEIRTSAYTIGHRWRKLHGPHGFEIIVRAQGTGGVIYARYVGKRGTA